MCSTPVDLQVLRQVFAGVFQLILIQDDVKHLLQGQREEQRGKSNKDSPSSLLSKQDEVRCGTYGRTLGQLVPGHHLDIEVFAL